MDTKAVFPRKPRGVGKIMKNEPIQVRGRRVLQDIGNLEVIVGGKPPNVSRPITRRLSALLLQNEQVAAEKNKNSVIEEVNDVAVSQKGPDVRKAAEAQKKLSEKPKPETVIVISSDEEEDGGRKSRDRSSRKQVKTLTSILTARSKAACELTDKPKNPIVNIDAADINDELAVVEYVEDIYKFYKLTEHESRIHDYMVTQPHITAKMRSILIDWLIQVHKTYKLMPETLYLTINIVDRYLSMKIVSRKELQLVGISSMLIACKYEEIWAPQVRDFVCISNYAYTCDQVLVMEKEILGKLGWYLTVPTPYVFLARYIRASVFPNQEMENMVFSLAELGVMHYPTVILYCPSMIAAAAVYAARYTLNKTPFWSETLKHYTGYSEQQLMDCAKQLLARLHSASAERGLS